VYVDIVLFRDRTTESYIVLYMYQPICLWRRKYIGSKLELYWRADDPIIQIQSHLLQICPVDVWLAVRLHDLPLSKSDSSFICRPIVCIFGRSVGCFPLTPVPGLSLNRPSGLATKHGLLLIHAVSPVLPPSIQSSPPSTSLAVSLLQPRPPFFFEEKHEALEGSRVLLDCLCVRWCVVVCVCVCGVLLFLPTPLCLHPINLRYHHLLSSDISPPLSQRERREREREPHFSIYHIISVIINRPGDITKINGSNGVPPQYHRRAADQIRTGLFDKPSSSIKPHIATCERSPSFSHTSFASSLFITSVVISVAWSYSIVCLFVSQFTKYLTSQLIRPHSPVE